MQKFIAQKISGIRWRLRCLKYGIWSLRGGEFYIPDKPSINGKKKNFFLLTGTTGALDMSSGKPVSMMAII
jgi:hypothetical protein